MRHHQPLIDLRRSGITPASVHLEAGRHVPEWQWWSEWHPDDARIEIERHDIVDRLDLQFLAGCFVTVDGDDAGRVRALHAAAHRAGAARVIAMFARPVRDTFESVFILDTAGVLTWSKP